MTSTTPQPGIFALGSRHHHQLEYSVDPSLPERDVIAALSELRVTATAGGATNLVIGFGPDLWRRLSPGAAPADLWPFAEVVGCDGHVAPSTQRDIWVWVHGGGPDVVHDTAEATQAALGGVGTRVEDCACFVYHDSRDLTGFIDGTANPGITEAPGIACVADGLPGAGGSHVITQRWVHDLDAFARLEVAEQEKVFGRSKADSVAIPRPQRPADAHISLAEIHDADGEEREIFRRSVPWGTVSEKGLYFIGFSAELDRFDAMLAQLFGTGDRTIRDHLLDFTTAVSGSYWFAPCVEDLVALGVSTAS